MQRTTIPFLAAIAFLLAAPTAVAVRATAGPDAYQPTSGSGSVAMPAMYKNCTALNRKCPHGVGKANARDKTTGEPVTTFKRSNKLYSTAMSFNKGLDRDKDRVACETA